MSSTPPTPPPCTGTLHTVVSGETLQSIASAFGVTLDQLVTANPQLITTGQILCVPVTTTACCLVLTPTGVVLGASGTALVSPSIGVGGSTLLVGAIGLPAPSTLGNFDTYFARFVPPTGPSVTFALGAAPNSPQPVFAGGTSGVTLALPNATTVLVFPGTMAGAVGPVVLQGTLANCH